MIDVAGRELRRLRDVYFDSTEPDFYTFTGAIEELERELAEAYAAASRWYIAASPYATPTALREALQLYEKALKMIAEFSGSIGDRPMRTDEKLSWAQEFAREALQGIDPTTGKT